MQFGFPILAWGFLLTLVPLLIHLINLLRHRRVKWAAMEFLLQSYKKHRKWVWLRQMLLLASRMAALALLVAILAQWKPQHRWFARFSGAAAHHYVLLDDSFSMTERIGGATAFDYALQAVRAVAERATEQDGPQRFTLIRFSRAGTAADTRDSSASATDEQDNAGQLADRVARIADLNAAVVDGQFELQLEERRRRWTASQLAAGPTPALQLVRQLVADDDFDAKIVYVISDFRNKEWKNPAEIRTALTDLTSAGAEIELVGCVRQPQNNLAVVDVKPDAGPRAAGVPLFVNVAVKNFGQEPVRNVQLKVRTRYFDDAVSLESVPGQLSGKEEELPVELIEDIPAGSSVTRRVQVFFPEPGKHVVEAILPDDAVAFDNHRWCVIDFRSGEPVLVIDGDPDQRNSFYLQSAFQPGPLAKTGIEPRTVDASFLRDTPLEELNEFTSIYLLDVPRLDARAAENLRAYVEAGGGLAVFLGPHVDTAFYNQELYRDGQGVLPMPLGEQDLMPPTEEEQPDVNIEGTTHPVFSILLLGRNPLVRVLHVDRYFRPARGWQRPENNVEITAQLRSRVPLSVEKSVGNGRVILFTSTYAPLWNDMALGPIGPVVSLQIQAYLAQGRQPAEERLVGAPLNVELNLSQFQPELKFVLPAGDNTAGGMVLESTAVPIVKDSDLGRASIGVERSDLGVAGQTDHSGTYEAWTYTLGGGVTVRRYAMNVDTAESDLALTDSKSLKTTLQPVRMSWRYADQSQFETLSPTNLPPNLILLALLVLLLVAEQAMAYFASYHPPQGASQP